MFAIICQIILKFVSSHQHLFVAAAVLDAVVIVVVVIVEVNVDVVVRCFYLIFFNFVEQDRKKGFCIIKL